jgi:hypothetical protein
MISSNRQWVPSWSFIINHFAHSPRAKECEDWSVIASRGFGGFDGKIPYWLREWDWGDGEVASRDGWEDVDRSLNDDLAHQMFVFPKEFHNVEFCHHKSSVFPAVT